MKKVLSVLCSAAVTLSLFTVSVSAASGYATDPGYSVPKPIDKTSTDKAEEANVVTAVSEQAINDAITSGTPIQIGDSSKITKDALATIIEAGKPVTFETKDGVSLEIDPASITDSAREIDLSMEVSLYSKAAQVSDTVKVPANSIVINPTASGEFGFTISITIPAQMLKDAGLNGNNVKLYYIDDNGNVTDLGKAKLNSDGSVSFPISHASQYVLAEEAPVNVADENEEELDSEEDEEEFSEAEDNKSSNSNVSSVTVADTGSSEAAAGNERNPSTGVTLALTAAGAAGLIAIISKKSKK